MFDAKEARQYLEQFIKREKAMRERVLRGADREDKIAACDRALDALDALAPVEQPKSQIDLFPEA